MTHSEEYSNDQDKYIAYLMERLRGCCNYENISANRRKDDVDFIYYQYYMWYHGKSYCWVKKSVHISKSDLEKHRLEGTIPAEIQNLL